MLVNAEQTLLIVVLQCCTLNPHPDGLSMQVGQPGIPAAEHCVVHPAAVPGRLLSPRDHCAAQQEPGTQLLLRCTCTATNIHTAHAVTERKTVF